MHSNCLHTHFEEQVRIKVESTEFFPYVSSLLRTHLLRIMQIELMYDLIKLMYDLMELMFDLMELMYDLMELMYDLIELMHNCMELMYDLM